MGGGAGKSRADGGPALEAPNWEDRIAHKRSSGTEGGQKKRQAKAGARRVCIVCAMRPTDQWIVLLQASAVPTTCCLGWFNPNPHPEVDKYYVSGASKKAPPKDVDEHLKGYFAACYCSTATVLCSFVHTQIRLASASPPTLIEALVKSSWLHGESWLQLKEARMARCRHGAGTGVCLWQR